MEKRFCTGYKTSSLRTRQPKISSVGETAQVAVSGTTVKESGPTPCNGVRASSGSESTVGAGFVPVHSAQRRSDRALLGCRDEPVRSCSTGKLDRVADLLMDLDLIREHFAPAEKLSVGLGEFETYIRNNRESIPNFGERYRQGETISTAFVESTINQMVSRRFVKLQQMHWTLRGAHLLLQTRTAVLNSELEGVFRGW